MVGNLFGGLVFYIESDHDHNGDHWLSCDQGAKFIAAFGNVRNQHNDACGYQVFSNSQVHGQSL